MEIGNILNIGVQGFQDATNRAAEAAQQIASQSVENSTEESVQTEDLTTSLIELQRAENDARANVKVVETASDLVGTLLDVKA
ncbi:hypothetical protein [Aliikangiella maris]|uniref:Flagellar basal-body/hook protein C-terminal domain-containing protein n=2 Tax=Aliikangiella maris TaxID=3162458 RepID=A0ABV2BYA2_9GAMM